MIIFTEKEIETVIECAYHSSFTDTPSIFKDTPDMMLAHMVECHEYTVEEAEHFVIGELDNCENDDVYPDYAPVHATLWGK